ncbi:MAG TPA: hypothetical protein DCP08_06510 [Chloroflexi bacterium]|nr:hypothetical protein [Chloroflexota bacterium]
MHSGRKDTSKPVRKLLIEATLVVLLLVHLALGAAPAASEGALSPPSWSAQAAPLQQGCDEDDVVCRILQALKDGVLSLQMVFPAFDLRVALEEAFISMLEANLEGLADPLRAALASTVFSSPQIVGGPESPTIERAWRQVRWVAALFWPISLALLGATIVSRNAFSVGLADSMGEGVLRWFVVVLVSGGSIYLCDGANRIANALTMAFLAIAGSGSLDPEAFISAIVNLLILGTVGILTTVVPGAAVAFLLLSLVMAIMGFLIVMALILQYVARYALIYLLVAIAPLALLGEIFPMTKWISRNWLRGFILVELLQPINALLFVLVLLMTRGAMTETINPVGVFVRFMVAAGVLSLLLTINFTVIKLVFGAINEVRERATSTVSGVVRLATVAGGALIAGAGFGGGLAGGGEGGGATTLGGPTSRAASAEALGTGLLQSESRFLRSVGAGIRTWGRERLFGLRREEVQQDFQGRREALRADRAERAALFEGLEKERDQRQARTRFGRQAAPLIGRMVDPELDAGAQGPIEETMSRLESAYGPEAFWPSARGVAEAIRQHRKRAGRESLGTMARERGFRRAEGAQGDPAGFVGAEIEEAIRGRPGRAGEKFDRLFPGPLEAQPSLQPAYRPRPDYYDFQRGARIADLLGEGPENIEVHGLLHWKLSRWGTDLTYDLMRAAEEVHALGLQEGWEGDPGGAFVEKVNEILSRPELFGVLSDSSLPAAWRWYSRRHAGR